MQKVKIDGVDFIPKETVISSETMRKLNEIYSLGFCEGVYDPACYCPAVDALLKVFDLIKDINKELRFKR